MQEHLKLYEDKMEKSLDVLLDEYASIRAGRANPHVLDRLRIDYYGTPTPIQQVGNVTVPEARMIVIQPWEKSLFRSGHQPDQRRQRDPPGIPGADRGAP